MATFATNPVADALDGTESIPLSQGGVDKRVTPQRMSIEFVNVQTGTTYTYLSSDQAKLVAHSNGGAIAGTLPPADSTDFASGWWMDVQNSGVGTLTITPTTSTIDGDSTLVLTTGQGARIVSDGTNYFTQRGMGSGGGGGAVDSVNGQTGAVVLDAEDIDYDNVTSGLTATDVQGAIDELAATIPGGAGADFTVTGTSYNVDAGDDQGTGFLTNSAAKSVNIDTDATTPLPAGFKQNLVNANATGNMTIVPAGGVTVTPPPGGSLVVAPGGVVSLIRQAADTFFLAGATL